MIGTDARVLDEGFILYARDYSLRAAEFDIGRRKVVGTHQIVVDSVFYNDDFGHADYDVSKTGTLIFRPSFSNVHRPLVIRSAESVLHTFDEPMYTWEMPSLSPDGQQAVVEMAAASSQLLLVSIDRPEYSRFTTKANNTFPVWTPDGEWITFISDRGGDRAIYRKSVSSDSIEILYSGANVARPGNWTPDGKSLVFTVSNSESGRDIWMLTYEEGWAATPLLVTADNEWNPQLSPDGSLLVYLSSSESGPNELYVQRFPELTDKRRLASDFALAMPKWDDSSRRVFYISERGSLNQVEIFSNGDLRTSTPQEILPKIVGSGYDVFKDGETFLTFADSTIYDIPPPNKLQVISGWTTLLEESMKSN